MDDFRQTIIREFSDLPSFSQVALVTLRLTVAALLGGLLGFEREQRGKAAGVRTHMLVCLGAAMFILVPQQAGATDADLTRVILGLVAAVGFRGGGTIMQIEQEHRVKGLTTAAGIWMTSAIGMAVGMGREATAILSTCLALAVLNLTPILLALLPSRPISEDQGTPDA